MSGFAQSGRSTTEFRCPLLGVKRTSRVGQLISSEAIEQSVPACAA